MRVGCEPWWMLWSTTARRAGDDRARSRSARTADSVHDCRRRDGGRPSGAWPCAPPSLVKSAAASIRIEDRLLGLLRLGLRGGGLGGFRRVRLDALLRR